MFELCLLPIIPSATAALKSDSIAARTAIEIAVGNKLVIVLIPKSGSVGFNSLIDGIAKWAEPSAKVPIVSQ